MTDEELVSAILSQVDTKSSSSTMIEAATRCREWAQAGIQGLLDAKDAGVAVDKSLIKEALLRWPNDMGPYLAEQISAMVDPTA